MIVSVDAAQLEVRVAALLSQDAVMLEEIKTGVDAHAMNCTDIMGLPLTPENRTLAKVLTFRALYGGTPYAFYMDSNMPNFSLKKWEQIMEAYYAKYKGLLAWQKANFKEVNSSGGYLVSPITHRIWKFNKYKGRNGAEYKWAEVANYSVQGTSFDFIALWMCLCNKELCKRNNIDFVMMVHDEIVYDCPPESVDFVAKTCAHIICGLDKHIEKFFNTTCNVPFACECKVGESWGTTKKYEF